jgi:GPH family glycoside/pentoside/hexuronide:cation symporter
VFAGGILMAISMVLLFWMPQDLAPELRVFYVGMSVLIYATSYSIYNVPYMAMSGEITTNYHQRSELMTYRVYAVGLSQVLATSFGPFLIVQFGGGQAGHLAMALALAPIILISGFVCYYSTKSAPFTIKPAHTQHNFIAQIKLAFANKPFFTLISVKLMLLSALGAQAIFPFFFTRILGVSDIYLGYYFLWFSVFLIFSQPFWYWFSRRIGKKNCFLLALGFAVPLWISWLLAGNGEPIALVMFRGALAGFLSGGSLLMGQALLPDTMEFDFLTTGMRREGTFAGFYTTVEKLSSAIGITVVGAMLSAAGYIQSRGVNVVQPPEALEAIRYITALFPAFVSGVSFLICIGYDLSAEKLESLRKTSIYK